MEATAALQDAPQPQVNSESLPDCLEDKIPASLYDEMWRFLKLKNRQLDLEFFRTSEKKLPVNILHTNFSTGKSILPYVGHQLITSYSNDHTGYQYAKILTVKFFRSFFGDIADMFLYPGAGRKKIYDLIISIPDAGNGGYHKLDGEKEFSKLSVYEYYSYRPQYLLKKGGYLCVILPQNEVRKITGKEISYKKNDNPLYDYNCFVEALISRERVNYSVLVFKKYEGATSQNGSNINVQLPEEYMALPPAERVDIINYVRERLAEVDATLYPKVSSFIMDVNNRVQMVFMLIAEMYNGSVGFIDFDQALAVIEAKQN